MNVNIIHQMSPGEKYQNQESRIEWNKSNSSSAHGSLAHISYIPSSKSLSYSSLDVPNSFILPVMVSSFLIVLPTLPNGQGPSLQCLMMGFCESISKPAVGRLNTWRHAGSSLTAMLKLENLFFPSISFDLGITCRLCPTFPGFSVALFAFQGVINWFVRTLESL